MTERPRYTLVPEMLKSFAVHGVATPGTIQTKLDLLFTDCPGERFATIVFDAFRCSSTLLACFAADLSGAVVMEKSVPGSGMSVEEALEFARKNAQELIYGGELSGKPIPGAIVGNSPIEACHHQTQICGRLMHFQSTNFARALVGVMGQIGAYNIDSDVYIIGFQNAAHTAAIVDSGGYDRIVLVSAGFFQCIALEDMVLGGRFISELGCNSLALDDDAAAMLACHSATSTQSVMHSWTARVLSRLSKADDVSDLVAESRIPAEFLSRMANTVMKVHMEDGAPVIRSFL